MAIRGTEEEQRDVALESAKGFSHLLRVYRLDAGLTQEELGARAGLSARTISDLERGIHKAPFRYTVDALARALDLVPEQATALDGSVSRVRAPRPTEVEIASPAPSVPRPLLPIYGRETELDNCTGLLTRDGVRLLTLVGLGGVGKTRLALEVAQRLGPGREVSLVRLEGIEERGSLLPAIARSLGLTEASAQAGSLAESISLRIAGRSVVLILDNFESVVSSRWELLDLLERCPELQALVTSRHAIEIPGEHTFLVQPLTTPDGAADLALEEVKSFASVQMFMGLVTVNGSRFELTADSARALQCILSRLDGLPLAIELAAGQTSVLTAQEILAELLEGTSAPDPISPYRVEVGRGINDAIAWSYALLPASQQRLLRMCSVFPEGWTVDHIAALEGGTSGPESMQPLIGRGFVQRVVSPDGRSRFRMLRLVKDFMYAELRRVGEENEARDRLADFVGHMVNDSNIAMQVLSSKRPEALLDSYEEDLNYALDWLLTSGRVREGVQLLWRVRYWILLSRDWTRVWLEAARNAPPDFDPVTDAMISALIAAKTIGTGRFSLGEGLLTNAISDLRAAGLQEEAGELLLLIAWAPVLQEELPGEVDRAIEKILAGPSTVERQQAFASRAARRLRQGDYEGSQGDAIISLEFDTWLSKHTDPRLILGSSLLMRGKNTEAHIVLRLMLDALPSRITPPAPFVLALMGVASQRLSEEGRAAFEYSQSMQGAKHTGSIHPLGLCLAGIAWLASRQECWEDAAILLGASTRPDLPHNFRDALDMESRLKNTIRHNLGRDAYEAAYHSGLLLPLDQVVTRAMQHVDPVLPGADPPNSN